MTVLETAPLAPAVELDPVRRGLVDPAAGCRDLDDVLDRARTAEAEGAVRVVVPRDGRHWPATAQALAVLLATSSVRVEVPVDPDGWTPEALARFAAGADRLGGDRLVVRVLGPTDAAALFAVRVRALWDGELVVGA